MKKILISAASILALGLFGCAAETSSPSGSTSEAVSSAPVVGEFQHCGGFINNAPVCDTGLKCQLGTNPDSGGICVKDGVGAQCGGFINPPATCESGLECVLNTSNPDSGGTCQYASVGQTCGGFIADAKECGPNLECKQSNPDVAGYCVPVAQKGQHCGGFLRTAPVCAAGLTCVLDVSNPDRGGTCE